MNWISARHLFHRKSEDGMAKKTAPVKKAAPAKKKVPAKKSAPAKKSVHDILAAELRSMIKDLDEEGLSFLVEQARVHLHNMNVVRLEEELASAARQSGKKGGGKKTAVATRMPAADFRIDRSPSGATYHIISGGKWKMFTDEEMLAMVKIAQSKDTLLEVSHRLWDWLDRERPDAFEDLDLEDHHDPRTKDLVKLLRKKFAVRKN